MCRTGCKTKDHESYAACCRSAGVQATPMWTNSKKVHSELSAYANARRQGVQPEGTDARSVERAMRASDHYGVAFNAGLE